MADDDNKVMSILAYIFFFVPLIAGAHKKSEAVKFHTNQGTVLFIACFIYGLVYMVLSFLLVWIPFIGAALIMLLSLVYFGFLALMIIGIINAANDKQVPLPVIGKFSLIK